MLIKSVWNSFAAADVLLVSAKAVMHAGSALFAVRMLSKRIED